RPGLHLRLHPRCGARAVRPLLHRRDHDAAGAAAGGDLERLHLPGATRDVQAPGPEGAAEHHGVPVLHAGVFDASTTDLRLGLCRRNPRRAQALGDQVIRRQRHGRWAATLALALSIAPPAALADGAAHLSVFASDDADDTSMLETGLTLDYRFEDVERYRGIKLERLDIRPLGGERWRDHRAYYRFADYNDHWLWNGQVGTDGDTVVGNANFVRGGRVRQVDFIERDVLY